jgi:hypothetical protein
MEAKHLEKRTWAFGSGELINIRPLSFVFKQMVKYVNYILIII